VCLLRCKLDFLKSFIFKTVIIIIIEIILFYMILLYFFFFSFSSDSDPEKLAQYIAALAKKVENDQTSRDRCKQDLEIFLEANTEKFVDTLFDALVNKTYTSSESSTRSSLGEKKKVFRFCFAKVQIKVNYKFTKPNRFYFRIYK
jgi:hypothetical protein